WPYPSGSSLIWPGWRWPSPTRSPVSSTPRSARRWRPGRRRSCADRCSLRRARPVLIPGPSCERKAMNSEELVDLGDLDELVRHVDRLCDARDWNGLVDLRGRCRRALERGRQLWPAASLAEYRLALDAPGRWAASVLVPGTGRFALGPLSEVAASSHTWDDLAPHVPTTPEA